MNILFITATYLPTVNGVSYYQFHLAASLRRLGHQVYIYAPQHPLAQPDPYIIRYPAVITPLVQDYPLGFPLLNLKLLNHQPLDLVHIHHPLNIAKYAMRLQSKRQLPFILTHHTQFHQYLCTYFPYFPKLTQAFINRHLVSVSKKAFINICPTPAIHHRLASLGINNTTIIPNGINLSGFSPRSRTLASRPRLIYIGRIEKEKNPIPLIHLASQLVRAHFNFHFTITGDGKLLPALTALTAKHKLNRYFTFTGRLSRQKINQLLPNQDLFVSFSTTEVMPLSYLEALACGIPLALTPAGQISGLTSPSNTLTINESPAAAAAQIIQLFNEPQHLRQLSRRAVLTAQKYDISNSARQIEKIYLQALK